MKKLSTAIALGLVALGAQAATVSFEFGNPLVLANTEIDQSGNLGLFDTNLGTLTDVEIVLNTAMQGQITLTLGAASGPQSVRGTATSDISWNTTLGPLAGALAASTHSLNFTTGFQVLQPGGSFVSALLNDNEQTTLNAVLDGFIASFGQAGGGNFSLGCTSISGLGLTGGGGFSGGSETRQAGCGAKITYTYDSRPPVQIPEPGSLALVGLALAAAGVAARRKA
jgi:hypothetical protein